MLGAPSSWEKNSRRNPKPNIIGHIIVIVGMILRSDNIGLNVTVIAHASIGTRPKAQATMIMLDSVRKFVATDCRGSNFFGMNKFRVRYITGDKRISMIKYRSKDSPTA